MSLLAVGSVAFDDLETPAGRQDAVLGGSASYFSLSASHFHPVQVVAVVGEDFSVEHQARFQGRPIDLEGLIRKPGRCFRWRGRYSQNLDEAQTLETQLNVFQDFHPELPEAYRESPFLFLGNIAPTLQLDVVDQMRRPPKWVALDTMNFWIEGARPALEKVLEKVDILLVNEAEARALSGEHNLLKAYARLRKLGPRIVVVKRGEHGAALFAPEGLFSIPAFPLEEVQDPTGAGDTFAGGFLGHLASRDRLDLACLKAAALVGSVMASFTVERFGTRRLEILTEQDIQVRVRAFSDMIRVEGL